MKTKQKSLNEGRVNKQDLNPTGNGGVTNTPLPIGLGDQTQTLTGHLPEQWPLHRIKPHPMNASLYGDTFDEALIESIKENGVLDPVVVQPDGTLLGGHRRLAAAKELGLKDVPVHVMPIPEGTDPVSRIIKLNIKRPKTPAMKVREYAALLEIEARKAKGRQGRRNILPDLAGCAREIAAVKVGLKHATAEKGLKVIAVIDEHTGAADAQALLDLMNRQSVDAAFKRAQVIGWIESKPRKPRSGQKVKDGPPDNKDNNPSAPIPPIVNPEASTVNQPQPSQAATPPTPALSDAQLESQGAECLAPVIPPPEGLMPDAAQTPDAGAENGVPPTDALVITTAKGKPQKHFAEGPGLSACR